MKAKLNLQPLIFTPPLPSRPSLLRISRAASLSWHAR